MVDYAPEVIRLFADQLYRRARWIGIKWATAGGLIGWGLAYVVPKPSGGPWQYLLVPLLAFPAALIGESQGFKLRLEAQRSMLQLKIEENTRPVKGQTPTV